MYNGTENAPPKTSSHKMRVLTEKIQVMVDQLYSDINSCSHFRKVVSQRYTYQQDWPIYLDQLFGNLIDKGHTPVDTLLSVSTCTKCKQDNEWICEQHNEYNDYTEKNT